MSVEYWWNDIGRIKMIYSEIDLSHCHIIHHKFHMV